jgi:mannose-6-phosphate isomerase-like protein (cupin superfamily)
MTRIEWKRVSLFVAVVAVLAGLVFALPDTSVGAEPQAGARGTAAIPTEPLYLPNHRYDLPATHVTAAQIQAHKAKMIADKDEDVPLNMVKSGGTGDKHQVGISVVYRLKGQSNPTYAVHDDVGEVYHVLEGAGTMLLGGKLTDGKRRPTSAGNGMGSVGTQSDGAKQVRIAKGDMLIIPAGTPHRWMMAEEFTSYTVVRIDAEGVTPLLQGPAH